jgi:ribosomal protein S19E (S16A)
MSRSLTSVSELWKEFHEGIAGNPSIQSLEERYGNTWRKSSSDSKFFSKRRLIIEKVLDIVQKEGVTTKEAISKLDTFRGSKTLDWLSKNRNSYE